MKEQDYLPTRHSLINRLKDWGDQASWQDFFDTYWRFIYGVALKGGLTEAEAQDVVQETVITVAKKIKEFQVDPKRSFKAWLTHTTRWRIADQFRKRARAGQQIKPPSDHDATTATIDRVPDPASLEADMAWEQDWEQNLLEVALEKVKREVDNELFQVFYLHVVKQWPANKVAETTGAKLPHVYFVKYKLTRKVKQEIARLKEQLI
jgi:RNA polymerase sigma-70 factor (ECF subfamily)